MAAVRKDTGRWIVTAVAILVVIFTLFIMGRNIISIFQSYSAVRHLEQERKMYETSIAEDSILLERLSHDEYLERYAREKYHMQREGEEVFLVVGND